MKNKFTLIELLVVIAIIGILVTILMPSLQSAKEKAKLLVCLNNHKQITIAYNTYAAGNNNVAVLHKWYVDFVGAQANHRYASGYKPQDRPLNTYLNDLKGTSNIAKCPSDKGDSYRPGQTIYYNMGNSYRAKYATSINIAPSTNITNTSGKEWNSGVMTIKFEYPSNKITFFNNQVNGGRSFESPVARWHSDKNPIYPVGFVDGHAEIMNFWWKPSYGTSVPRLGSNVALNIDLYGYY